MWLRFACFAATAWITASSAFAQTTIAGGDITNLNWTVAGNPYVVTGAAIVPAGETLTIGAGVRVEFNSGTQITASGNIIVNGTASDRVVFTKGSDQNFWLALNFNTTNQEPSFVRYADFDFSFTPISLATQAPVSVENSTFSGNLIDIIINEGRAVVDACEFELSTFAAIAAAGPGSVEVYNSVFREMGSAGINLAVNTTTQASFVANSTFFNVQDMLGTEVAITVAVVEQGSPVMFARNVILTGFQTGAAQDLSMGVTGSYLQFEYSNLWNNVVQTSGGVALNVENISADPLFVNDNNLRLRASSPSIDSGTAIAGITTDFDGLARPGGLGWDMGAFEVQSICGNGITEIGESCDDGVSNGSYGFCNGLCTGLGARCGDGTVQSAFEECDDADLINNDECTNACTLPVCGDMIVQSGEECDDGNSSNADACLVTCQAASCGDGVTWTGNEACDDGAQNGEYGFCNGDCTALGPRCGDASIQADQGEECDDGNTTDDDVCTSLCTIPRCGDTIVQSSEECDDGNDEDEDDCLNSCVANVCNDGILNRGVEVCDDGNPFDDDGCTTTCLFPGCGDAIVDGAEECDDGNVSNNDACLVTCIAASCGDGFTEVGVEECDDGNDNPNDACDMCTATGVGPGAQPGSSGCGVTLGSRTATMAWVFVALVALVASRRRRVR